MPPNEYQHDSVKMVFNFFYLLVLWTKVVAALKGLHLFIVVCFRVQVSDILGLSVFAHSVLGQVILGYNFNRINCLLD